MNNSNEINYRTALQKPDCADNWLTEIEIEFEKVSEELEMDITLIFPITERPSRPRRIPHNHHPTLAASPALPRPAAKPPAAAPPGFSVLNVSAVVSTVEQQQQYNPKIKDRGSDREWAEGVVEIKGPV
ncbi:uncharacterized protein LAJ45_02012 [Morchella importuna]|uniref:uncharacterized protein n=1 Tax=Morchella importuna TaxID=1174673 RepID=UPI001E8CEEB5|nr:uncharacterized protein LAJ45_02012 [Morchella importuna]KAH8154244.1 hypothetical protein LAJ45_02012 [Morchella importuna]